MVYNTFELIKNCLYFSSFSLMVKAKLTLRTISLSRTYQQNKRIRGHVIDGGSASASHTVLFDYFFLILSVPDVIWFVSVIHICTMHDTSCIFRQTGSPRRVDALVHCGSTGIKRLFQ